MTTGIRMSLYLRKRRDRDLIAFIKKHSPTEDISEIIREVMRDGLKYREMVKNQNVIQNSHNVIQSHTPQMEEYTSPKTQPKINLHDVEVKKKELSDEELENKLDNF